MRTRILGKMLNSEVQEYLGRNDIIIVAVGTTEMHGGLPLDCETVLSEAYALKMAEACDGLCLTGLPYFYSGATASGRGTVQVSIREGIDYLGAIARNLLRIGFRRQIYISFHGPAHMTICPMIRDFYDETGVPILYMDLLMQMMKMGRNLFSKDSPMNSMLVGGYKVMNRIDDVPLVTGFEADVGWTPSNAAFADLSSLGYQSAAVGYCFGDNADHAPTPDIPDIATRDRLALEGEEWIDRVVGNMNLEKVVADLRKLEEYGHENEEKFPWMPSSWNNRRR